MLAPAPLWIAWPPPSPCAGLDDCLKDGQCSLVGGACIAATPFDCVGARVCVRDGRCTPVEGVCRATSLEQCAASEGCRAGGRCLLDAEKRRCDDGTQRRSIPTAIAGATVAGLGVAAIAIGAVIGLGNAWNGAVDSLGGTHRAPNDAALPLAIGGIVGVMAGTPMLIYGLSRAPRETAAPTPRRASSGVHGGPGAASFAVPF